MLLIGETPHDPRSRAVVVTVRKDKGAVALHLECGHVTQRRPQCVPSRVICRQCQGIITRP